MLEKKTNLTDLQPQAVMVHVNTYICCFFVCFFFIYCGLLIGHRTINIPEIIFSVFTIFLSFAVNIIHNTHACMLHLGHALHKHFACFL